MTNDAQNNFIVRYLLGDLPESDRLALEERYFADSETFDRMWENENRLVDHYVRGRLAPADRERFERHYLASPVHRQRVATARNLLAAADESIRAHSAPVVRPSLLQRLTNWSRLSPAWQFAMAAGMLLLAVGGGWLLRERAQLRDELAAIQAENAARQARERELANQISAQTSERDQLAAELERLRKQQLEPRPSPSIESQPRTIFSFALLPVAVRGGNGQQITVPRDADQVQFRLPVEEGDVRTFQASIRTLERNPVWTQQQLKLIAGRVVVNVPAGKLPFGDYILDLSAVDRAGNTRELKSYSFRVIRE
ncbi:MAG: hypothetical protein ACREEM_12550 [Blastocatellia bacterium]